MFNAQRLTRSEPDPEGSSFRTDVLRGLTARRKSLPAKHFYDAAGSRLFEAICALPEYYVTRTETALLARIVGDVAALIPQGAALVEFGSGASVKTRLLLDAAPQLDVYVPIDISDAALGDAARALNAAYPALTVLPLLGDFTAPITLPKPVRERPVVGFFPGSTIGNFAPADAVDLLRGARTLLGKGAQFLVGADLVKSPSVLVPAYDDAQGVTAAFNKNLLVRINRELGAAIDPDRFRHRAVWNATDSRIEMHLVSLQDQTVEIAGRRIAFAAGETIHTENSYKFTVPGFTALAEQAGWRVQASWTDADFPFGVFLLAAPDA